MTEKVPCIISECASLVGFLCQVILYIILNDFREVPQHCFEILAIFACKLKFASAFCTSYGRIGEILGGREGRFLGKEKDKCQKRIVSL